MLGTMLTIVSLSFGIIYISCNWGKMTKGMVIFLFLLNIIMPTLTYIYTIPRMDTEMQDVRTAIANKQKTIMIDTTYLWASQINKLRKEIIEAGYTQTQESGLVFTIKEE
jgi:hypothetical protein